MRMTRRFTRPGRDAYAGLTFAPRSSRIVNPNGSVVFEAADVMVPEKWSQVAVDILAQKYFRRAGVPAQSVPVDETDVPEWLRRRVPATPTTPESRRSRLSSACCVNERATFAISVSAPLSTASRAAHSRQPLTPRIATQVITTKAAARSGRRLHPALCEATFMRQNSPMTGKSAASLIEP